MRNSALAFLAPCALLLSACSSVPPSFHNSGVRQGPCVSGGPDSVAQQFYDYRIAHPGADALTGLRPYLSDELWQLLQQPDARQQWQHQDLLSSNPQGFDSASVASASSIPNNDARNMPLRVTLSKGSSQWRDEVLMVREGTCWAVGDIRYLGASTAPSSSLRLSLDQR